jgi:UDP-glucose 4-epimerase
VTRILVTGASGFVGRALVAELANSGHSVRAAMRQPADVFPRSVEVVAVADLTRPVEWRALLKGVETVIHLAGIAHAGPGIAEEAYDRVNRLATAELASAARSIGIRHLVFMSSIRAQSGPSSDKILRETDPPHPTDAYGRSKLAAEDAVRAANVPFTILRPVLIYGSGVKGNLERLIHLAQKPWPLPFGLCRNRRSLLARQNLIAAIHHTLQSPAAKGGPYVADRTPLTLGDRHRPAPVKDEREVVADPPAFIALAVKPSAASGSEWAEPWWPIRKTTEYGWRLIDTSAGLGVTRLLKQAVTCRTRHARFGSRSPPRAVARCSPIESGWLRRATGAALRSRICRPCGARRHAAAEPAGRNPPCPSR